MDFKKKISLFAVLSLVFVFAAGSAFAGTQLGNVGAYERTGDIAIFNYYDIRTMAQGGPGLTDNYFTVVNNDGDEWYQAHVRVRTGSCSVELLDFDVLLSPRDVFTFDILQDAEGDTVFASCDTHTLTASQFGVDANGCFVLDSGTFPAMLSLIQTCGQCPDGTSITASSALEATRWGYVEVIGEVELEASDVDGGNGANSSADECTTEQLENGEYNAFSFQMDINDGGDCASTARTSSPTRNLFGKQYYATFDASQNLLKHAQQNAYHGDDMSTTIHRPCYSNSSPGCSAGDGELENPFFYNSDSFAYEAASTSVSQGATDLNWCFWKDEDTNPGDIENQNGAAATFGPTFADFFGRGSAATTTSNLVNLNDNLDQRYAVSHYFAIPGLGMSRYVFTFPIQHFLNQTISVSKDIRLDTEQNECSLPQQKFISPGIPTPGVARGEVTIVAADEGEPCDFNEGWVAFELAVTDDGPNGCDVGNCWTGGDTADDGEPAVFGTVINWGDAGVNSIGVSPLNWDWSDSWN
jgi:hypothetical protein